MNHPPRIRRIEISLGIVPPVPSPPAPAQMTTQPPAPILPPPRGIDGLGCRILQEIITNASLSTIIDADRSLVDDSATKNTTSHPPQTLTATGTNVRRWMEPGPLALSQVCRAWRQIAIREPELWSRIVVATGDLNGTSVGSVKAQVAAHAHFSGTKALQCYIVEPRSDPTMDGEKEKSIIDAVLGVLVRHAHRVVHLVVQPYHSSTIAIPSILCSSFGETFSNLDTLVLKPTRRIPTSSTTLTYSPTIILPKSLSSLTIEWEFLCDIIFPSPLSNTTTVQRPVHNTVSSTLPSITHLTIFNIDCRVGGSYNEVKTQALVVTLCDSLPKLCVLVIDGFTTADISGSPDGTMKCGPYSKMNLAHLVVNDTEAKSLSRLLEWIPYRDKLTLSGCSVYTPFPACRRLTLESTTFVTDAPCYSVSPFHRRGVAQSIEDLVIDGRTIDHLISVVSVDDPVTILGPLIPVLSVTIVKLTLHTKTTMASLVDVLETFTHLDTLTFDEFDLEEGFQARGVTQSPFLEMQLPKLVVKNTGDAALRYLVGCVRTYDELVVDGGFLHKGQVLY